MKGLIRLTYYKIIDATSVKAWDKVVFDETYQEFFMQAQRYDQAGQYPTFAALLANVPRAAELHYLSSRAAMGYLQQLNQVIPDVVNAVGKSCLPFTQFKFEVLASDVTQKAAHRIAISFYSDPLTWIDTVGDRLLVAYGDQRPVLQAGSEVPTDLIAMQPYLSISSFQGTFQP
ncbi:hypothetical protein [Fibrella aquatilis]|uniref:Uncharacterized protein n=1 Tax=Fibrella aquatilis TaxID=2817059 RepID=A0A939G5V0_9BACT|nr:hypothetical protein [Fibrella aquatilis]MBO0931768.1 hypothetical protein [Fibrella aquatilis]